MWLPSMTNQNRTLWETCTIGLFLSQTSLTTEKDISHLDFSFPPLALWKRCLAEWNATDGSSNQTTSVCRHNCTEKDTEQSNGHYSECPKELLYYCIHGECRYIKEQKAPSCRCHNNYNGARCEYVTLDWQIGGRGQIIIGCAIAVLLLLMILVISICVCSHCRRRMWGQNRRQTERRNGTEKRGMLSPPESTELTHIDSV
ncbi:probetacellulin isoform X2 [Xiphophorus hellerii]|uniref:probetacellulin isoform X2 n=1 Tax=Xiphophorus hellerii TaxID=8084 RepID=UPI0013B428BF|nr:probetacellulin-like isoform X2 [Xiphophorus hellerii]